MLPDFHPVSGGSQQRGVGLVDMILEYAQCFFLMWQIAVIAKIVKPLFGCELDLTDHG